MAARRTAGPAAVVVALAAAVAMTGAPGTAGAEANPGPGPGPGTREGRTVAKAASSGAGTELRAGTGDGVFRLKASGTFVPAGAVDPPQAVTYDRKAVPTGSRIVVTQRAADGKLTVGAAVRGLRPHHTFGAHVHTQPCGERPGDAGPHYQNVQDPVQPSTDPEYANPENEVWLDMRTDASGSASAVSRHDWNFRKGGARSVVLHAHATHTGPGGAGDAGKRLACFSVPFGGR